MKTKLLATFLLALSSSAMASNDSYSLNCWTGLFKFTSSYVLKIKFKPESVSPFNSSHNDVRSISANIRGKKQSKVKLEYFNFSDSGRIIVFMSIDSGEVIEVHGYLSPSQESENLNLREAKNDYEETKVVFDLVKNGMLYRASKPITCQIEKNLETK